MAKSPPSHAECLSLDDNSSTPRRLSVPLTGSRSQRTVSTVSAGGPLSALPGLSYQPPSSRELLASASEASFDMQSDGEGGIDIDGEDGDEHDALHGLDQTATDQAEALAEELECQNIIVSLSDLPVVIEKELTLPLNPFRMKYPGDLEIEYREWAHMQYIPSRAWLVVSALFAELDIFTYGYLSTSTNIVMMHTVVGLQFLMALLLSIPALYPYRRWLILSMGLHNFFWTGLATEQAASRISGVHQNTFIVLPFYCSFACVMAAQIPVRFTMFIFVVFPVINALWRILNSFPLRSACVLLVWWWLIAAWGYLFERITRQLFVWVRASKMQQQEQMRMQTETEKLLSSLIPPSICQYLLSCNQIDEPTPRPLADNVAEKKHSKHSKTPAQAPPSPSKGPSTTTSRSYAEGLIMVVCFGGEGQQDLKPAERPELNETFHKLIEQAGFQKITVDSQRCVCIKTPDSTSKDQHHHHQTYQHTALVFMKAIRDLFRRDCPAVRVSFAVHLCPLVAGLVVTPTSLRYTALSEGFKVACALAMVAQKNDTGALVVLTTDLAKLDLPESLGPRNVIDCPELREVLASKSANFTVVTVDLSRLDLIESQQLSEDAIQIDPAAVVGILLSMLNHSSNDPSVRKLGPVPSLNFRGICKWQGITFHFAPHERNFRQFVLHAIPELFLIWIGCQLFCGLWSFVSMFAVILPCHPYLPGGVYPWAGAHLALVGVACPLARALFMHLRSALVQRPRVNKLLGALLLILLGHYALSIAVVYVQPNLTQAGDWNDYVASIHGDSQYEIFENQTCINMLYNMAFFLLFTLYFCISVVPVHIATSYRMIACFVLFLVNTVMTTVLFHHTDYKENALMPVVFLMTILVESLVRLFYKSLLVANRCHMDIAQTPAMQNRHVVMLASMPQRLMDSPDHTIVHPRAAVILLQFAMLDHVIAIGQSSPLIFEDVSKTRRLIQSVFDRYEVEWAVIHMVLRDGSPGFVILVIPSATVLDFSKTLGNLCQTLLGDLIGPLARGQSVPPIFKMACATSSITESCQLGVHTIEGAAEGEAYDLLAKGTVNVCAFGSGVVAVPEDSYVGFNNDMNFITAYGLGAHDSMRTGRSGRSKNETATDEDAHSGILPSTRRMSKASKYSKRSGLSKADTNRKSAQGSEVASTVISKGLTSTIGGGGHPRRAGQARQLAFLVFVWSPTESTGFAQNGGSPTSVVDKRKSMVVSDIGPEPCNESAFTNQSAPSSPTTITPFNGSYIRDVEIVHRTICASSPHALFQQHVGKRHALMILSPEYQHASTTALKVFTSLKQANAGENLRGIGVAIGPAPKRKAFIKVEPFLQALGLATMNSNFPLPDTRYGLPVLISSGVYQWAQSEYAAKLISVMGHPVYRLCEKLKQGGTDEWMYMLHESNKSNRYAPYNTAMVHFRNGKMADAMAALKPYLVDHPDDEDANRLAKSIGGSSAHPFSRLSVEGKPDLGGGLPRGRVGNGDGMVAARQLRGNSLICKNQPQPLPSESADELLDVQADELV